MNQKEYSVPKIKIRERIVERTALVITTAPAQLELYSTCEELLAVAAGPSETWRGLDWCAPPRRRLMRLPRRPLGAARAAVARIRLTKRAVVNMTTRAEAGKMGATSGIWKNLESSGLPHLALILCRQAS